LIWPRSFQKLIDEYNAGSRNIEAFFAGLKDFTAELTVEEQRGMAEGLTEEELALFDILTRPEPVLTKTEEAEVKKVCRELLETLRREKLVLDWREKQQAKAAVMQTLKIEFRRCRRIHQRDSVRRRWRGPTRMCMTTTMGTGGSAYRPRFDGT
jgi:type I restriction enzyme R subunit